MVTFTYGDITTEWRGYEDWIAFWHGDRRIWEHGNSEDEAIGALYRRMCVEEMKQTEQSYKQP